MVYWSPGLGLLATSTRWGRLNPSDGSPLPVALAVNPDFAIIIYAGLEQEPRATHVASTHRFGDGERHTVPDEGEPGYVLTAEPGPRAGVRADLPARVARSPAHGRGCPRPARQVRSSPRRGWYPSAYRHWPWTAACPSALLMSMGNRGILPPVNAVGCCRICLNQDFQDFRMFKIYPIL